tara:strand:+ start:1350 stop:1484 length:135 start_codon:yes stop_codon:yes gene_type:complete
MATTRNYQKKLKYSESHIYAPVVGLSPGGVAFLTQAKKFVKITI